ncbi:hypothetical protein KIPB_015346, partial [Kipferlia bialata]
CIYISEAEHKGQREEKKAHDLQAKVKAAEVKLVAAEKRAQSLQERCNAAEAKAITLERKSAQAAATIKGEADAEIADLKRRVASLLEAERKAEEAESRCESLSRTLEDTRAELEASKVYI